MAEPAGPFYAIWSTRSRSPIEDFSSESEAFAALPEWIASFGWDDVSLEVRMPGEPVRVLLGAELLSAMDAFAAKSG
jgi:hypothetical protein